MDLTTSFIAILKGEAKSIVYIIAFIMITFALYSKLRNNANVIKNYRYGASDSAIVIPLTIYIIMWLITEIPRFITSDNAIVTSVTFWLAVTFGLANLIFCYGHNPKVGNKPMKRLTLGFFLAWPVMSAIAITAY